MRLIGILAVGLGLAIVSSASFAFEEQKIGAGSTAGGSVSTGSVGESMGITTPELKVGRPDAGTKIRVPGLGVIGEIPKMDFGLELLYGASQNKQLDSERNEANGVMLRSKIPLGSSR